MWWLLVLLACDGTDPEAGDSSATDTAEESLDGEGLYLRSCGNCHGVDGAGVSAPSLADRATGWTAEEVADVAINGAGYMGPQNVTETEALEIGDYVVETLLAQ